MHLDIHHLVDHPLAYDVATPEQARSCSFDLFTLSLYVVVSAFPGRDDPAPTGNTQSSRDSTGNRLIIIIDIVSRSSSVRRHKDHRPSSSSAHLPTRGPRTHAHL